MVEVGALVDAPRLRSEGFLVGFMVDGLFVEGRLVGYRVGDLLGFLVEGFRVGYVVGVLLGFAVFLGLRVGVLVGRFVG